MKDGPSPFPWWRALVYHGGRQPGPVNTIEVPMRFLSVLCLFFCAWALPRGKAARWATSVFSPPWATSRRGKAFSRKASAWAATTCPTGVTGTDPLTFACSSFIMLQSAHEQSGAYCCAGLSPSCDAAGEPAGGGTVCRVEPGRAGIVKRAQTVRPNGGTSMGRAIKICSLSLLPCYRMESRHRRRARSSILTVTGHGTA